MNITTSTSFYAEGNRKLYVAYSSSISNMDAADWLEAHDAFPEPATVGKVKRGRFDPWWLFIGYDEYDYRGFALFGTDAVKGMTPYPRRLYLVEIRTAEDHRNQGWATWIFQHSLRALDISANGIDYDDPVVPLRYLLDRFRVAWAIASKQHKHSILCASVY